MTRNDSVEFQILDGASLAQLYWKLSPCPHFIPPSIRKQRSKGVIELQFFVMKLQGETFHSSVISNLEPG